MILENTLNNKFVLSVKNVLDGKIKCDTYNLRICFYNGVIKQKARLEASLKELKEKGLYEDEFFQEYITVSEEKLRIYNDYLDLLAEREKNNMD